MCKEKLLLEYKKEIEQVRNSAKNQGVSDSDFEKVFNESIASLKKNSIFYKIPNKTNYVNILIKLFLVTIVLVISIYVLLNVHQPTSSIVLRNVQGLIYPGLKFIRFLSVPIIKAFPALTNVYDESCLLENPYFYVHDMECWPCKNVHSVIDYTEVHEEFTYKTSSNNPFIVKTDQKLVDFPTLQITFSIHKSTLIKESNRLKSTNSSITTLETLFNSSLDAREHTSWRINKMNSARIVRELFPRPIFLNEWSGQSVERFVMIDGIDADPYTLPNMECSYIFVVQGSGERTIILKPSKECSQDCKIISVVLKPSYTLWYNWWYYRPISLPAENSTQPSISYVSSYC